MEKQKIVVFGGNFDPFTDAHRAVVQALYRDFCASEVVVAPSTVAWHREGKAPWMSTGEKLRTIGLMLTDIPYRLYPNELLRQNTCSAVQDARGFVDTLADVALDYYHDDTAEMWFCIGSDQLELFPRWKMPDEILKLAKMVVVQGRGGKTVESAIPHESISIPDGYADMSASGVRAAYAAAGKSPKDYMEWAHDKYARVKRTDTLLRTPIFDVVKGPETGTGLRPIKINAPDWVSIMVEKGGKLLVERQFRYGADDFVEEFPCGMVEKGEDPLDAAVRELEEETGIKLLDKTEAVKLGRTNPNPAFMTNAMHYYYVNLDRARYESVGRKLDDHEEIELKWKDKARFMFDLADDAHACGKKQVPAIALSMVKLYENASNYPGCG